MNTQILSKAICRVLFAAAVATTATFAANAASRYWTGASDTIWDNTGNWEGGNSPGNDEVYFQNNKFDSKFTGESGSVITFTNSFSVWRTRLRGAGSEQAPLVLRAADSESGLDFGTSVGIIVADSSGSGYLRIESGTYPISAGIRIGENATYYGQLTVTGGAVLKATNGNMDIQNGKVVLDNGIIEISKTGKYVSLGNQADGCELHLENGGVLTTSLIWDGDKGKTSTVLFNGGTLKANGVFSTSWPAIIADKANISVKVGANGGTIDASGFNIQVARPIAAEGANDGGMTFKGGGSVTLKYANTYTGETKIAVRTKLVVTGAELARMLANGGIRVVKPEGISAKGTFKLLGKSDGDCTAEEYALISKGTGLDGVTFDIDEDGDITVTVSHTPQTWAGAAETSAAWSGNNWDTGVAFDDGNDAVFATDGAIAEVDGDFSAYTLTFNDNAVLTGTGTLTVPTITVAEGKTASIAGSLAGPIEKTGAGTLTLGYSRADTTTTLTEGTLVANAPIGTLVFGTDYPVTFDYCGQTLSTIPASAVGGGDVTLKNGTFGSSINVNMNSGSLRVEGDSTVVNCNEFNVGPSDGSSSASYVQIGGMFNAGWHFRDRCGDFIMTNVTINASKNYEVGSSAATTRGRMILSGGSASIVGNFNVFNGELEIMNETVEVAGSVQMGSNGNSGLITLKSGGMLTTKVIQKYGTPASATVLFDGGTLKANAENANGLVRNEAILSIQTSANGGTIDAAGYAVTVHREIENKSGESGAMTYKGGGKVTLTAQPTYTGVTTVEVGTTLVLPAAVAGDKLAFTIPGELADGVYTVVSISGDSQFADDVLSGKAEGFVLSGDKKKICYVQGMDTAKPIYIGTDGNLSATGNWLDGMVPTGGTGDAQIFCATAATFSVGDAFAPATITIPSSSALVTIGSGTLYVKEVVNRQLLVVGAGATVVIGDQLTLAKGESLCDQNNGTLVVSNLLLKAESGDRFVTEHQADSSSGVFKFNAVTNSMTGHWFYMTDRKAVVPYIFYIGAGGLAFQTATSSAAYCLGRNGDGDSMTTIRPWYSDFTIADRGSGNRSLILQHYITFCTDDENGDGRTITIDAKTRGQHLPVITVSGSGKLQVNGICDNSAQPEVTLTDSATLAFGAGASLGTGAITLGAGTTLVLTQPSGSNEFTPLANTLNLPTGENEVATIRIDGKRLKSGVDHEIATVGTGTIANVTLDSDGKALDGRKGTLRVEDGKLMLNIQPSGLRVIIR